MSQVNLVIRTEHHALSTCPCDACRSERERREGLVTVPACAARVLGFTFHGRELVEHPSGSLAKRLRTNGRKSEPGTSVYYVF